MGLENLVSEVLDNGTVISVSKLKNLKESALEELWRVFHYDIINKAEFQESERASEIMKAIVGTSDNINFILTAIHKAA